MAEDPIIAGIDEAGRGALAGPVVAAACILPFPLFKRRASRVCWSPFRRKRSLDCIIADSKQMTPSERDVAYAWIVTHCTFGVGIVSHDVIDREGILAANERAMQRALHTLRRAAQPTFLLVDGCDHFWFDLPHASVIRGDESEPCIAAASILAKVTRDRLMMRAGRVFGYGFEGHKGYGSEEHIDTIRRKGPCAIHRKTFLRNVLASGASTRTGSLPRERAVS
jgi:ribonuclease HII